MNICISWILHHLQMANHSQLWVVTQTNPNYDLLVLCVPCEQRPLVYPRKTCTETSCVPTKNVYVSSRQIRHWNLLLHKKPQIKVVICADVSENRLPETKNNFSGIDISWPTPSVSLSVPSCSLGSYSPALVSTEVPVDQPGWNVDPSLNQAGLSLLHKEYN